MATASEYAQWIVNNADKKGTPEFNSVAQAYKAAREQEMSPQFSPTEMIGNIPSSAVAYGQNIASAVLSPVQTVSNILDVGAGELQKVLPEPVVNAISQLDWNPEAAQRAQDAASIVNNMYKQKYGSGKEALKTIEQDPVGFLSDVSSLVTGGASVIPRAGQVQKIGAAIEPLNIATNVAGYGIGKAIPKSVAPSLYESAAKWSTTLPQKERAAITETALREQIMPTFAGVGKTQMLIDDLGTRIDDLVQQSTASGKRINANDVLKNIQDVRKNLGGFKIESKADINQLNSIEKQFRDVVKSTKSKTVTPEQLQKFKQDIYKRADYGKDLGAVPPIAKEEAYKAMGRAAKETLESQVPGIGELNVRQGALLNLFPNLQRAAARIENRDLAGIGVPIKASGGQAIGGDVGAAVGVGQSIFDIPKVKAKTALKLYKTQNQGKGILTDNNVRNALLRQFLQQQGYLQQQGLLTEE